jgi:formylglycine-generating enzyme required for sulfatase activity
MNPTTRLLGSTLLALLATAGVAEEAGATFTRYSTTREVSGSLVKYTLYGNFDGPTDTVLNAVHFARLAGSAMFHHADALNGGVDSTMAGTWNPQFVLVPGAMDSYVCIGGGEGFASGNSTAADPDWGAAGFNAAQPPYGNGETSGPGWFNQNPPNFQGRVNASGQVKLGQFVIALADEAVGGTYRLKLFYNDGIPGSSVQFADAVFALNCSENCNENSLPDCIELAKGLATDCDANGILDECDLASGFAPDCNGNQISDFCDLLSGTSSDCDANGVLDECDVNSGSASDCNGNQLPDSCDLLSGTSPDCDANGIPDECDLASGLATDCDADGILDTCEGITRFDSSQSFAFTSSTPVEVTFADLAPSYLTGITPRVEIRAIADLGAANDALIVQLDGGTGTTLFLADGTDCPATPDLGVLTRTIPEFNALVADGQLLVRISAIGAVNTANCTGGGISVRLVYDTLPSSSDCNLNGQLDSCELADGTAFDCNGNGVLDACDVAAGLGTDCNGNGALDSCDIASETSSDLNGNGIPDECAGEWIVGGSGFATIQSAIDAAPGGTTIRLGPGDYNEPVLIEGKRIILTSTNGTLRTTLYGNGLDASIVTIQGPEAAGSTIDRLTFRNGSAGSPFGTVRVGGAISVLSTPSVTIGNCTFVDNACPYGGGVYCFGGSGAVNDCYFSGNSATFDGGGLEIGGQASWLVQRCTFVGNAAAIGGAMHLWSSTVSIIDTTFTGNMASDRGSAISWYSIDSGGTTLDGCSINRNTSPLGGALVRVAGTGAFDLIDTRFCLNAPDNYSGSIVDAGGNIFGEDCDGNGICNDAEIRDTGSSSFVWEVSEGGNGHRYLHLTTPMTWEQAREYAEALGGHLATITSAEEQAALVDNFLGLNLWIGGFQPADSEEPDGGWQWVTGEPWAFTAWKSGEPNDQFGEDRLNFHPSGGWNDSGCPWACYFRIGCIIEFEAADFDAYRDCNGNGVPDACDIADGSESDCDANGVPDSCDIASGASQDIDGNGVPDECKPDCDGDGLPDAWELANGFDFDCDADGVPDYCEIALDTDIDDDHDGRIDACEFARGDFNLDGVVNGADLAPLLSLWGAVNPPVGDLDGDNIVTAADLAILLGNWGTVAWAPVLSTVAPRQGSEFGGTAVTLRGAGFDGATGVFFDGVAAASFVVIDATTINAVTPAHAPRFVSVEVVTGGGDALVPGMYEYMPGATPAWATVIAGAPDPAVVYDAELRAAILATGWAWKVRDNGTGIEMLLIPPGTYDMGCSASNLYGCSSAENPVHPVTITQPFYMSRTEVTQAQWTAVMGLNPSFFQSASAQVPAAEVPNRPVETVSWNTIQGFLSATGMRLPTEAEWEYAYRAATTTAFHGWAGQPAGTNDDNLVGNIAWYSSNAGSQTRPVGGRAANGFGLHDMSGNVFEWVSDWAGAYSGKSQIDPTGPTDGSARLLRGGSPMDLDSYLRSSSRYFTSVDSTFFDTGFRVVRNP